VLESDPLPAICPPPLGEFWKHYDNGVPSNLSLKKKNYPLGSAIALNQKHPNIVLVGKLERANRQSSSWAGI